MKPSKRRPSALTLLGRKSLPEFDKEETTKPGWQSRAVQDLADPDVLVTLGNLCREVARQGKVLDDLVDYMNARARKESLSHLTSSIKGGSVVGLVIAIFEGLKAAGIIK